MLTMFHVFTLQSNLLHKHIIKNNQIQSFEQEALSRVDRSLAYQGLVSTGIYAISHLETLYWNNQKPQLFPCLDFDFSLVVLEQEGSLQCITDIDIPAIRDVNISRLTPMTSLTVWWMAADCFPPNQGRDIQFTLINKPGIAEHQECHKQYVWLFFISKTFTCCARVTTTLNFLGKLFNIDQF